MQKQLKVEETYSVLSEDYYQIMFLNIIQKKTKVIKCKGESDKTVELV